MTAHTQPGALATFPHSHQNRVAAAPHPESHLPYHAGGASKAGNASTPGGAPAAPRAPHADDATARDRMLLESMVQMSLRLRLRGVDLESATGLAGRELDLVALLTASGPTSVKSLVADLQLPRSTMTAIVDRLEERGLVLRHPNPADRRSVVLESTPRASEALIQYRKGVMTLVEHIKAVLSEEEAAAFSNSVQKIAHTL